MNINFKKDEIKLKQNLNTKKKKKDNNNLLKPKYL